MRLRDYQIEAAKTSPREGSYAYYSMKLSAETGEVIDLLAKFLYQGKQLDRERVQEEIGDALWSLANLARVCGVDLDDCAIANIQKIRDRFPQRFSLGVGDVIRQSKDEQ